MTITKFDDDLIPYFSWDRDWTVLAIRKRLKGKHSLEILAWLMREAKVADVWAFVSPSMVMSHLDQLKGQLGRKQTFWEYILNEWHKLGKI